MRNTKAKSHNLEASSSPYPPTGLELMGRPTVERRKAPGKEGIGVCGVCSRTDALHIHGALEVSSNLTLPTAVHLRWDSVHSKRGGCPQ